MNPYRPQYTPYQDLVVRNARKALIERWRNAPFSDGQPRNYGVQHQDEQLDGSELVDCIRVHNTTASLSAPWSKELRTYVTEFGDAQFTVLVPHRVYLRRTLPCSIDRSCLGAVLIQLVLIVALVALALMSAQQ